MTLPNDYHRCRGVGNEDEGFRDGCENCLRRTSPHDEQSSWIEPPGIIVFWCEYLIEEGDLKK